MTVSVALNAPTVVGVQVIVRSFGLPPSSIVKLVGVTLNLSAFIPPISTSFTTSELKPVSITINCLERGVFSTTSPKSIVFPGEGIDAKPAPGRPRKDRRPILNAIIHRFRTGCQWNHLPKEFGDDSTIHGVFQHWVKLNLFEIIWAQLLIECGEIKQVQWEWQAADGWLGKARMGGDKIGPNPTDRAKNGTKKSLLTDGAGGPLSFVIASANVNDHILLEETLNSIVVRRPKPLPATPQHLCLDKGYDYSLSSQVVKEQNYKDHIRRIGEEKLDLQDEKRHPARR